eukprot:Phypoly_transcript_11118.p1 GENE.Phypoly_transcript_11118~~Phypoly_transcript_11118.p1  ORF type:complete len:298 (+),score=92.45 Phypoly_transcript_11118:63-956(+)
MTTKKAERPVKELEQYSRPELVALLEKQQKLLANGTAAKLPDKGEKIKKSIEKIENLIKNYPKTPLDDLESNLQGLSLKPKPVSIPAASIGDLVEISPSNPRSPPEVAMEDSHLPPTARPIVQKLFETTENPEYNKLRKEHLDLFVRGRRGAKFDEKKGFKGSVALGLEEAINLRDAWREQKQDKAGRIMGDENERTIKYELTNRNRGEGEGEEQEYEEEEGAIMELDDVEREREGEGKKKKKREGEGEKKKEGEGKGEKEGEGKQKEEGPVWDVQEDIKDIMDMIPPEYKQPQKKL